jgi:hypothetical protein
MRTFATLSICLLFACKHEAKQVPASIEPPMTASSTGVPGTQDLAPLGRLAPKMAAEAGARPTVKVPVEKLFDALKNHGVEILSQHQVLATTAAASYCMLGVTKDTIAIAVCEYPTHDAALAGEKLLDARYKKLVPDAVREVNGNTLVTVANAEHHPSVRDRVFDTFKAL